LFQSAEKASVPQTTCHQKKEQLKKKQLFFCCRRSQSSHVLYPSFVVATLSATPTRKKNTGQCLRPPPLVNLAVALSPSHQPQ
jgi:hypothetical protein